MRKWNNFLNRYFRFRPAIVYAYSCIDPEAGLREWWAYIGQTRQQLLSRHHQHMGIAGYKGKKPTQQPWSDLYPEVRIVWQGKCPDYALDLIEEFYIKTKKPVYNDIHNRKNRRRIPIYLAREQRIARDYLRRHPRRGRV